MSSTAPERLERLNAYLISKGLPPKTPGTINYVKRNIGSATRNKKTTTTSKANESKPARKNLNTPKNINNHGSSHSSKKTPIRNMSERHRNLLQKTPQSTIRKAQPSQRDLKENIQSKTPIRKHRLTKTPKVKTPSTSVTEHMRRKLVRRSINVLQQQELNRNITPKTNSKTAVSYERREKVRSKTPKTSGSLRKRVMQCKSAGPRMASTSRTANTTTKLNDQEIKLYEKLNNWLLAKGKKPLDGRKLRGFKPTKTIATPVGSPARTPKAKTPGGSHWPGLRDEDDSDELTVLIRHTMKDVQDCIDEGCPTHIIRSTLQDLADKMPGVKSHAKYWVALIQIEQKEGMSDDQICDLLEKAVLARAQPLDEIKEAINNLALKKIETPKYGRKIEEDARILSHESSVEIDDDNYQTVPSNQCKTPNPMVERFIRSETPILKNAATSPIVFESPQQRTDSPSNVIGSPSSVVKLRMVSKSSPVFNRLKALRALPGDARAIITPVRRSTRIAAAHESYPRSLQDHEACLSTVQEIFPSLAPDQKCNVTCDIVFDPNMALGDSFADISTVLKF
ncbi:cytoskeleton-associated protein 2-like [Styela clava]